MHSTQKALTSLARRYWYRPNRSYCSSSGRNGSKSSYSLETSGAGDRAESSVSHYHETYKKLDKLDFLTAAKILFSENPRKKKFGLDFHLVQLFFACMPSFAVYLVAQYARYEMRRMEAELEQKKQKDEEEEKKLKEMESEAEEEEKRSSREVLAEMKVRLDKLEETVKEIFVDTEKRPDTVSPTRPNDAAKKDKPEDISSDSPKVAVGPRHKAGTENGKPS
ncbi:hypothetical protein MLD38_028327 [Melastoma candidum]|uniref:Uncharacterized protein n=1 Tax=Melastoma candidum TaxID=119954 RepID=A0ACB9N0F6_9MYRT|nr:hypothetical protein MLD38_028327 [Melastoma candidum]